MQKKLLRKRRLKILKSLSKACKDGCLIKVRYGKVLICGASEAGKTNFLNLLLENKFQPVHISTELAKSQRIAMKAKVSKSDKNKVMFAEMKINDEIKLLRSYLPKKYTEQSDSIQDDKFDIPKEYAIAKDMIPLTDTECDYNKSLIFDPNYLAPLEEAFSTHVQQPAEKIWDILTFMDTGGQPQFISMLPAVNNFSMITFIVHKMTEFLDSNVVSKHRDKDGKDFCMQSMCEYKHHQLIKTLMSYASSVLHPDKKFLSNYKKNTGDDKNTSSISIIGTFSSDINEEDIKKIDEELRKMVGGANIDGIIKPSLNSLYEYLVPVDNKTQEKNSIKADTNNRKYTDPSVIRKYIHKWLCKQDTFYVPIQWLLLELEIRKICMERECKFITYDEVLNLSRDKDLGEEDFIQDGLRFHHLFGVLLYFEEVEEMRKLIIVDHQWLFDKLTAIVLYSFGNQNYDTCLDRVECEMRGIFKETMLDELDVSKDFANLETETIDPKKSLLGLLQYLRIIAPLTNAHPTQYFMPSLLSSCSLGNLQKNTIIPGKNNFITDTNEEIRSEPLLIQFRTSDESYSFPRGLFCFLIVELMHSEKWKIDGQAHDNFLSFIAKDINCYVTLIDRISCLEVQITQNDIDPYGKKFITVRDAIVDAFDEIRNRLSISFELKFGFWCKNCKEQHLSVLEGYLSCHCKYNKKTRLQRSHMIWFVETFKVHKLY